jgi:signal peptidase I
MLMNNAITCRFIDCYNLLLQNNGVRSARQFAISLDYLPQNYSEILKGRREVTIELIRKAVEVYHFNPVYLCLGKGNLFYSENDFQKSKILRVVTDGENNERIVHVPVKAQAGYAANVLEGCPHIDKFETYTLPNYAYNNGTFRSFEVSGDSMYPSLEDSDMIICSYVDNNYWDSSIKDHHVYVIVTEEDILVKRVVNNIRRHRHLELVSDNELYPVIRMNIYEIKEIWYVRSKISNFCHNLPGITSSDEGQINSLLKIVEDQSNTIKSLERTLNSLLDKAELSSR